VKQWWPAALIVVGLVLLILFLVVRRPSAAQPAGPIAEPGPGAPVVEPGAPAAQTPAAILPWLQQPAAPASAKPQTEDIYDVLAQQPPESTPGDGR
jgi:hypothetical protein